MSKASNLLDSSLTHGLRNLYKNHWPTLCDIKITCSDGKTVWAHKLILAIHSEYFAALFRHEPETSEIVLPQFESDLVKLIIKSLIDFEEKEFEDFGWDQMIRIADYFQMKDLMTISLDMIAANITKENLKEILKLTETIHTPKLLEACTEFMKVNIQDIFESNEEFLQTLSKSMLLNIFSNSYIFALKKSNQ